MAEETAAAFDALNASLANKADISALAGLATTASLVESFTVTNSTVAATDTVNLSVKSGTGIYLVFVTAVAAGSFKISVFTPAAVSSAEAPVINFSVIKGAAS